MTAMSLNANEVLGIAVQAEEKARAYYRAAASEVQDASLKEFFERLRDMEDEHVHTFSDMREALSDAQREVQPYDPGNEMLHYLSGMESVHAWEGQLPDRAQKPASADAADVLRAALKAEKEMVFFYTLVKDFVPADKGRDAVQKVLKEEAEHAAILHRRLSELSA